jgi:Mn2+/Fe2+ NRAMP family transporter
MFDRIYCNISEFILMFDKIIENLVLLIVFGVLIIGTFVMVYSSNKMNQMYFDSPIIETNTDKIA